MSGPALVALIAALWFVIGLCLSLLMGRRGHDGFSWLVIGTLLGPLALPLAFESRRREEELAAQVISGPEGSRPGVDVVAGVDGSTHSRHAIRRAAALFGPRLGRLTLVAVVPFDSPNDATNDAAEALERAAKFVPGYLGLVPKLEIVHGHAAAALQELARREGYDVLVIGTRGTGLSKRLLGSTASELSHATHVPVLLIDGEPTLPGEAPHEPMSAREACNTIAVTGWARRAHVT